jgi:hypothetical protein
LSTRGRGDNSGATSESGVRMTSLYSPIKAATHYVTWHSGKSQGGPVFARRSPGLSPHDFYRGDTIASLRQGVDLLTFSQILRHTSLRLLPCYAKQTSTGRADSYRSVLER